MMMVIIINNDKKLLQTHRHIFDSSLKDQNFKMKLTINCKLTQRFTIFDSSCYNSNYLIAETGQSALQYSLYLILIVLTADTNLAKSADDYIHWATRYYSAITIGMHN